MEQKQMNDETFVEVGLRAAFEKVKQAGFRGQIRMTEDEAAMCTEGQSITELVVAKDKQLAEARADADHWKSECNALQRMVHEARAEIEALKRVNTALNEEIKMQRTYVAGRDNTIEQKDKLIEQMREALESIKCRLDVGNCSERSLRILGKIVKAALAAERGEK